MHATLTLSDESRDCIVLSKAKHIGLFSHIAGRFTTWPILMICVTLLSCTEVRFPRSPQSFVRDHKIWLISRPRCLGICPITLASFLVEIYEINVSYLTSDIVTWDILKTTYLHMSVLFTTGGGGGAGCGGGRYVSSSPLPPGRSEIFSCVVSPYASNNIA